LRRHGGTLVLRSAGLVLQCAGLVLCSTRLVLQGAWLPFLLLRGWFSPITLTATAAMSPAMSPFAARLTLTTRLTLTRLPFDTLILKAVFTRDRSPVALAPGKKGGRIALRAD
jgi:hypothetical protein